MRINGKTAIVTGASSGIGREVALNLARGGADVVLIARNEIRLQEVAARIESMSRRAYVAACDLRDDEARSRVLRAAEAELGPADILVNAAGIGVWKPFMDISEEEHRAMMETNYWGCFGCIRQVLPGMLARGSGSIVNISAGSGKIATGVTSGYSAAMYAVSGFSEALYREYRSQGIRVCCIHPASVRTAFWNDANIDYARVPPIVRYSPRMSARSVARNVRLVIWTGMPVRTFPFFLGLLVRCNALWIRLGDLLLWKWFLPVLLLVLVILYLI